MLSGGEVMREWLVGWLVGGGEEEEGGAALAGGRGGWVGGVGGGVWRENSSRGQ